MKQTRDSKGRFRKTKSFVFWLVVIAIFASAYYAHKKDIGAPVEVGEPVQIVKESKIDEVMNEADFKKKMELEAKKIVFERERKAENTRHEEAVKLEKEKYEAKIAEIETNLESVRKEELSFTKAAPQQK